jgi:hypothetical protein
VGGDRQQHRSQRYAHVLVKARLRMFATLDHCHVLLSMDREGWLHPETVFMSVWLAGQKIN